MSVVGTSSKVNTICQILGLDTPAKSKEGMEHRWSRMTTEQVRGQVLTPIAASCPVSQAGSREATPSRRKNLAEGNHDEAEPTNHESLLNLTSTKISAREARPHVASHMGQYNQQLIRRSILVKEPRPQKRYQPSVTYQDNGECDTSHTPYTFTRYSSLITETLP